MKELFAFKAKNDKVENSEEIRFILKKPTRSEAEDVEIFYASTLSFLMNQGVQTRAAVDKYYLDNSEGVMPKEDERELIQLRKSLAMKEEQVLKAELSLEDKSAILEEIISIQEKIRGFNSYYSEIYDNTAEIIARNKTIDYCLLNFSYYEKEGGKPEPLFKADDDNPKKQMALKYEQYDELLEGEEGDFYRNNIDKLIFLFTLWYMGAAETANDFAKMLDEAYEQTKASVDSEKEKAEESKEEVDG